MDVRNTTNIGKVKLIMLKGEAGNSIVSIELTTSASTYDEYTITLTDGTTQTFRVAKGKGIVSIELTGKSGSVDTYTITYTDGTTDTFTVSNGRSPFVDYASNYIDTCYISISVKNNLPYTATEDCYVVARIYSTGAGLIEIKVDNKIIYNCKIAGSGESQLPLAFYLKKGQTLDANSNDGNATPTQFKIYKMEAGGELITEAIASAGNDNEVSTTVTVTEVTE